MEPFVGCFCKTDADNHNMKQVFPVYGHVSCIDYQVDSSKNKKRKKDTTLKPDSKQGILTNHSPSCHLYNMELNKRSCQKPGDLYLKFTEHLTTHPPSNQPHTQCGFVTP